MTKRRVIQIHENEDRREKLAAIKTHLVQFLGHKVSDATALEYAISFTAQHLDTARDGFAHTSADGAESE